MDRPSGSSADPGVGGRSTLSPEAEAEIERMVAAVGNAEIYVRGERRLPVETLTVLARAAMAWAYRDAAKTMLKEADWLDVLVEQSPREWKAHADTIANNLRAAVRIIGEQQ